MVCITWNNASEAKFDKKNKQKKHDKTIWRPEVSSKKIIVEANTALLSLKKDSGIVKGSRWPDDGAALTQEGPECPKNWTETT